MKRLLFKGLAGLAVLAPLVFGGDALSLRLSIPSRPQFDSVSVRKMYAIKLKNKKTSYMTQGPEDMECVNSVFPHLGDQPCWYLRRHTQVVIDMDAGPSGPLFDTP